MHARPALKLIDKAVKKEGERVTNVDKHDTHPYIHGIDITMFHVWAL